MINVGNSFVEFSKMVFLTHEKYGLNGYGLNAIWVKRTFTSKYGLWVMG